MKIEHGSFTVVSPGNKIITLDDIDLAIDEITLYVVTDTNNVSTGHSDGTINYSSNQLHNELSTDKSIIHYRTIASIKTKTISATVPSTAFDYPGEFEIYFDTMTQNTTVYFTVKGS